MLSFKIFIDKTNNNEYSEEVEAFMQSMNEAYQNQHYLNNKNFNILQEYILFCKMLQAKGNSNLNSVQQKVVFNYQKNLTSLITPTYSKKDEETGTPLVYKPNGFITIAFIIGCTVSFGLAIAYLFISRL